MAAKSSVRTGKNIKSRKTSRRKSGQKRKIRRILNPFPMNAQHDKTNLETTLKEIHELESPYKVISSLHIALQKAVKLLSSTVKTNEEIAAEMEHMTN